MTGNRDKVSVYRTDRITGLKFRSA